MKSHNHFSRLLLLSLCLVLSPQTLLAEVVAPSQLACELLTSPEKTVIYDPQPEFSWVCGWGDDAFQQAAYQIEVSPAGNEQQAVWNSGRVPGSQSVALEYDGQALKPATDYQWRVQCWTADGQETAWSEPQIFRTSEQLSEQEVSRYPLEQLTRRAVDITQLDHGNLRVDFGKAAFGYARLELKPTDTDRTLTVHLGEKLRAGEIDRNPGGTIRSYSVEVTVPANQETIEIRPPRDRRNTSGAAIRLPREIGVITPFRYLEIAGLESPDDLSIATQIAVQYPFDPSASHFECSDPLLQSIWDLCKYSIQATTFCGVYVDGDRERIPYEADAYLNQLSHYAVDNEYALARYSHEYLLEHSTWPTEWKQHSILMAWADYLFTGDRESLEKCYPVLKAEKLLSAAATPSGLLDTSGRPYRDIVDWPEAERDGFVMRPINTVVNAFHYACLERMAKIATAIGHDDDAKRFAEQAQEFKKVFNAALWDAESRCYIDGVGTDHASLHANLFPLAFGLVPEDRIEEVVAFLKPRGMACSVYAAQYLLEGLYAAGADDYAFELLTATDERSWQNMIRSGSTITLEAWDIKFKPNLDWNHAWGAAPANLIPLQLVGIQPTAPGFARVRIQPQPADLESFNYKMPTIRGPIEVSYQAAADQRKLIVSLPGNTLADIAIPLPEGQRPTQILCNGEPCRFEVRGRHAWIENVDLGELEFVASFSN